MILAWQHGSIRDDVKTAQYSEPPCMAQTASLTDRVRLLEECLVTAADLWRPNPFRQPDPDWLDARPELASVLLELCEPSVTALEDDPGALRELLAPHLPELDATLAACEPTALAWPPVELPDRFAGTHVPGRKWNQIQAFIGALPPSRRPVVDWCAGKGHLGRTLARLGERSVRCLERQPELARKGAALATGLPVRFELCDVMAEAPRIAPDEQVLALHACGALHERLLDLAEAGQVRHLSLAPCCYHLTPAWRPRAGASRLALDPELMQLAVQDTATAPARVRRARLEERAFRTGFDALQRQLRGVDAYLPTPSWSGAKRPRDFAGFCAAAAAHHGLRLPAARNLPSWLELGFERDARSRRLELLRHGFRRALELYIVHDRAVSLEAAGFTVRLARFCPRQVTPRNLLLQAWR